jgi:hypothetical protein
MEAETKRTIRRTTREAVIFTLLGPFVFVIGFCGVQAYKATRVAPYTTVLACENSFFGATPADSTDRSAWDFVKTPSVPCALSLNIRSYNNSRPNGRHDLNEWTAADDYVNRNLFVQRYDGSWIMIPNGAKLPGLEITRTINNAPIWSAYIHPLDALSAALVFGWPLGFGVWIFYRIVRFAIRG